MNTAASVPMRQPTRLNAGVIAAIVAAVALVAGGLAAWAGRPAGPPLRLVSMTESARTMAGAGAVMQAHGQAMLAESERSGSQDLVAAGEHWRRDGQALVQGSRWLAMDPTAPASLATSAAELARQGSWGELVRTTQAMQHDPSQARTTDLEALRWAGLAMRAEGRTMVEHGRVMLAEVDRMTARHGGNDPVMAELRQAAQALGEVGGALEQNGQQMIDYAGRLRRGLGQRDEG